MRVALTVLLTLYCLQSLAKSAIHFLVPYDKRIRRMAANYRQDHRLISRYDTITLVVQIAMVALLFATHADAYSFLTGLFVGMSLIQVYLHRFIQPLPPDKMPESPMLPVKLVSYAIQARPALAWREYLLMSIAAVWGLYVVMADGWLAR